MVSKVYQNRIKNDIKEIVDKSNEIEEIKHKGLRGAFRESTIGKIFKKYLSLDWDIGAGEIIDSMGNTSNKTDLIFSIDTMFHLYFLLEIVVLFLLKLARMLLK